MPNSYAIIGRRARPGLSENLSVRESIPCFSYFYHLNSFIYLFTWILRINYGEIDGGRSTLLANS